MSALTSKTIEELQIDEAELRIAKQRVLTEKQALQVQLTEVNAERAVLMPKHEFVKVNGRRAAIIRQISDKEQEISAIKAQLAEVLAVIAVKSKATMHPGDIRKLVDIRDRWHGFSMDPANHQKGREVAWKISQEIREVLKRYFDAGAQVS